MSRNVVGLFILIGFSIVVGGFVRLALAHADTASFLSFLTSAAIPTIPAVASWLTSRKAHAKGAEAVEVAQSAADSAAAAENNTNGKMAAQFAQVRGLIQNVDHKLDQHLLEHMGSGQ